MQSFRAAPWSRPLKIMSLVSLLLLSVIAYFVRRTVPASLHGGLDRKLIVLLVLATPAIAVLFIVAGYELDARALRVRRLLWSTSLPLAGIERAWHDPWAMKGSLRVFGNGGMFSITGLFQSKRLGRYRAFVTDPSRAVVLVRGRSTLVLSPEVFLRHLGLLYPGLKLGTP
jgi:PH (Pleckstrin Homology) domain-containing protein